MKKQATWACLSYCNQLKVTKIWNYYSLKFLILVVIVITNTPRSLANERQITYTNQWAVEIIGGDAVANEVAETHGFINHGKILEGEDFYFFSHPKLKKRSLRRSDDHHEKLSSHIKVFWAEQQQVKRRVKRDYSDYNPENQPNDGKWAEMWYMLPSTRPSMRIVDAWKAGYSGKDVSVTILDDGIEHDHPDLHANYDAKASTDINDHDDDPQPRLNPSNENRHGTRCAGEVAAIANNGICSIGIAYDAKIGGVRMLDGQVTDAVEAASIGLRPEYIDIYSASWGPDDDGKTVDGPAKMARAAFVNGVKKGRGGKGSIFVWASGNGGRSLDNCNCDGYTDSIYTLSISSATQRSTKPWYSESCSSTLATTYSSGSSGDRQIVTTDLRKGCTSTHTGTSASAPLAAAICALALEANPNLTWRDMQHLVVQTANPDQLIADDWVVNGVNRKVSHAFGYGLMDAYAMVTRARNWTMVPPQRKCTVSVISEKHPSREISSRKVLVVPVEVLQCDDGEEIIERLEHVQAVLTLRNEQRGQLVINLKSAKGTKSQLLGLRRRDYSSKGFSEWAFMTTHSWDEDPQGRWELEIMDKTTHAAYGSLSMFNLTLYGTRHADWHNPPESRTSTTSTTSTTTSTTIKTTTRTTFNSPSQSINSNHRWTSSNGRLSSDSELAKNIAPQPNTLRGCAVSLVSGEGCMVCRMTDFLDPVKKVCLDACPDGHYVALETYSKSGEKLASAQPRDTVEREEVPVSYDGYVCRKCAIFCHKCVGPKVSDCVQCVAGANMEPYDSSCTLKEDRLSTSKEESTVVSPGSGYETYTFMFIALIVMLLLAVTIVGGILLCQSRKSRIAEYKYLPTGDGSINRTYLDSEEFNEYHDDDATEHASTETNLTQHGYHAIPSKS
ncbi:furin-1-like isoform X2 [Clavelina lepadiformis]|uniref:furin-1-like isoform X2 n=1 Tax=Clavelina lepadiformis TaxID=159417 RepID=UPI004041A546